MSVQKRFRRGVKYLSVNGGYAVWVYDKNGVLLAQLLIEGNEVKVLKGEVVKIG